MLLLSSAFQLSLSFRVSGRLARKSRIALVGLPRTKQKRSGKSFFSLLRPPLLLSPSISADLCLCCVCPPRGEGARAPKSRSAVGAFSQQQQASYSLFFLFLQPPSFSLSLSKKKLISPPTRRPPSSPSARSRTAPRPPSPSTRRT